MLLYYIRHGAPIYDPDCLTPLGKRQAEAVGRRLALHGLDEIYVSSSERAKQTAAPAAEILGIAPVVLDWANESYAFRDFAVEDEVLGGRRWLAYHPKYRKALLSEEVRLLGDRWYEHEAFRGLPFEEGMKRVDREVDAFLLAQGYRHDRKGHFYEEVTPNEKRIALFAHQGFSWIFFSSLLDIPYPTFVTHFDIQYTGVSVVRFANDVGVVCPKMLQHSSDGHLYAEKLPTRYGKEDLI